LNCRWFGVKDPIRPALDSKAVALQSRNLAAGIRVLFEERQCRGRQELAHAEGERKARQAAADDDDTGILGRHPAMFNPTHKFWCAAPWFLSSGCSVELSDLQ
jgi:hypothetical protein